MTSLKTKRQQNAMDGDSSQGIEFKDLYISARQEVLENGHKLRELNNLEMERLKEYTKRNCKFYRKTSKFQSPDEAKAIIIKKLKILYIYDSESEETEVTESEIEEFPEEVQKLVEIVENIDYKSFQEQAKKRTSEEFLNESKFTGCWISRVKVTLFGTDELYWILIIGESESLEKPNELDENGQEILNPKDRYEDLWKTIFNNDQVRLLICSNFFAAEIEEEYGNDIFYKLPLNELDLSVRTDMENMKL